MDIHEAATLSSRPTTKRKTNLTALPEGFTISEDLWDWATKKQFPRKWVERELEKFCDHNRSKGQKYIDWDAAFRNWLLKAEEFAPSRNGHTIKRIYGHTVNGRERIPL